MASGLEGFPGGYPLGFMPRRSVVDPETGAPVVTSAPTGAVRQRSALLPVGRDDSGALVPAVPQGVFDAIDAVRFPGQVLRGEKQTFDPATGHVSDEAIGAATGLAGLAMTGGLGGVAADGVALGAGPARRLSYDSPLSGPRRVSQAQVEREIGQRVAQADGMLADPARAASAPTVQGEADALTALLPKFGQESFPRGRPFEPRRVIDLEDSRAVRVQEAGDDARTYRVFEPRADGSLGRSRGAADLTMQPDGRWRTDMLGVDPAHQGKGLASSLYRAVEQDTGQPLTPSGNLSPDGYAFWQKRDPQAVQFHQPVDGAHWSPRRITDALASDMTTPERAAVLRQALDRVPPEGKTPEALARQHYLVPGSIAAGAGAAALALPGEARAAPSQPQDHPMSAGSLPGFGLIPNAGPDDVRRLLQLMPFDPSQPVPIMGAGGTAAPDAPRGLQGQMPRAPSQSVGLLDMADLNGPAGAQIHHPGTAKPSGSQPAIAMNEADTQRMERETGMMPPAPPSGGLLSEMFSKVPMGAPQSFAGTSGTIMPDQNAGLTGSPLPPARPSAADLAAPLAPARPPSFGSLSPSRTARPQQADMPAPGAVPTSGTAPGLPAAPNAAPQPQAPAATSGDEGSGFLSRLGDPRVYNTLLGLGQGLLSTPGLGAGIAAGTAYASKLNANQAATNLAQAEFGLRSQKAVQEATGLKGNQAFIKAAFPHLTPEQVAGGASNSALVSAAIAKMQNSNAGREMKADSSGVNRWVDTGQPVFKDDEGKADWQQVSLPNGGTMLYSKSDPSKTQVLVPGQAPRAITPEERQAFGIPAGTPVKMTKDGPVAIGSAQTNVNVGAPEKEQDKIIGKGFGDQQVKLATDGRNAGSTLNTLSIMEQQVKKPDFYSGVGADAYKRANQMLGALGVKDARAASAAEVFDAFSNKVVLDGLGGSLGPGISNTDRDYIARTAPTLERSREGNLELIRTARLLAQRQQDLARMARDYAARNNGRIDAGFDQEMTDFVTKNPLFPQAADAVPPAPAREATPAAPSRATLEAEARRRGLVK